MRKSKRKPKGYWTLNNCMNEAAKFNTRTEWKKMSYASYLAAHKNNWLNNCTSHMIELKKQSGYWTKEKCINDALKYKTIKDWRNNSKGYQTAKKLKITKECSKHMLKLGSKYLRLIYGFEFADKSIYVGLTHNSDERKIQHKSNKDSQVYKHIQKTGLQPEFKVLTEYLDKDLASIKEGEFLEKYKNNGWTILNKAKTGGLGGDALIWTKDKCLIEALKYQYRSEWRKNSQSSYNSSIKHKWFDICCKHMKRHPAWNKK